jgi:hypothetical protein
VFVDDDGSVMRLGERLVMVRGKYVRFIAMAFGGETEVDYELFCAADAEVRMDESYFFHHIIELMSCQDRLIDK